MLTYQHAGDEVIPSRELVAQVTVDSNAALANFEFISGENETTLFDGKFLYVDQIVSIRKT